MSTSLSEALPTAYEFGRVIGRFLRAVGDGEDVDSVPEAVPAKGTVTFTPITTSRILIDSSSEPSPLITHEAITCTLDAYGHISRNGVRGVWLWTGEWNVAFNVSGISRTQFPILVTNAHTDVAPLDLWEAVPYTPPAGATVTTMLVPSNPTDGYVLKWSAASSSLVWGASSGTAAESVDWSDVTNPPATYTPTAHKASHATGGTDTLTPADIGAQPAGSYAPASHTQGSSTITDLTEAVQDVVGAMVAAAGGTYNDAAGTITLPAGGATVQWTTLTETGQAITLPAPTQGTQLVLVLTQDATGGRSADWSGEDIVWEGGGTPTVPAGAGERAVFTMLGTGTGWLGFLSGAFGAPVVSDTTNPTAGALAGSMVTQTTFRLTVSGASDDQALHAQPYSFSLDNGATWSAYQTSPIYDATGRTANAGYQCRHRTRDAAGNVSTGTAITVATLAASIPAITDSFDRADSTTGLGTTDTGHTWQQVGTGVVGIIGGAAYRATSNAFAVVDFGQADMMVSHKMVTLGDFFAGHVARYVDANNYYTLEGSGAGGTGLMKVVRTVAGVPATVVGATIPGPVAAGDVVAVSYKEEGGGTKIRTYKNGVQTGESLTVGGIPTSDTTAGRPMGTKAGLKPNNNANIRLDDFRIEVPA